MNVTEIVHEYLNKHGYDGLFNDECGCSKLDVLIPCDEPCDLCEPGYLWSCDACQEKSDCPALVDSEHAPGCIRPIRQPNEAEQ